jgi:molecular chaperone GrpE (heat shock protein)
MISLGISFWLYYVRSLYLRDGPALVPEKWGRLLNQVGYVTNQSNVTTMKALGSLIEASNTQTEKSESLLSSFLTLQETISNRDEEISRLKKGHDSKIFKRFINRFIGVSVSLEEIREEQKDSDQAKNYKYLSKKIQSALEECGVEQLYPAVGYDYRQMGAEVVDDPRVIETNDESKNFQIASVESPAYVIEGEGDREIVLPSKVTIYRTQQQGVT